MKGESTFFFGKVWVIWLSLPDSLATHFFYHLAKLELHGSEANESHRRIKHFFKCDEIIERFRSLIFLQSDRSCPRIESIQCSFLLLDMHYCPSYWKKFRFLINLPDSFIFYVPVNTRTRTKDSSSGKWRELKPFAIEHPLLGGDDMVEWFKALKFLKSDRCCPRIESGQCSFHPFKHVTSTAFQGTWY